MSLINRKRSRHLYETSEYQPENENILCDEELNLIDALNYNLKASTSVNNSQQLENLIKAQLVSTRCTIKKIEDLIKKRQNISVRAPLSKEKNYIHSYIPPVLGCPDITPSIVPDFFEINPDEMVNIPSIKRQKVFQKLPDLTDGHPPSMSQKLFGFVGSFFSKKPVYSPSKNFLRNNKFLVYLKSHAINRIPYINSASKGAISNLQPSHDTQTKCDQNDTYDNVTTTSADTITEEEDCDLTNNNSFISNTIFPHVDPYTIIPESDKNYTSVGAENYLTPKNIDISSLESDSLSASEPASTDTPLFESEVVIKTPENNKIEEAKEDSFADSNQNFESNVANECPECPQIPTDSENLNSAESLLDIDCRQQNIDLTIE